MDKDITFEKQVIALGCDIKKIGGVQYNCPTCETPFPLVHGVEAQKAQIQKEFLNHLAQKIQDVNLPDFLVLDPFTFKYSQYVNRLSGGHLNKDNSAIIIYPSMDDTIKYNSLHHRVAEACTLRWAHVSDETPFGAATHGYPKVDLVYINELLEKGSIHPVDDNKLDFINKGIESQEDKGYISDLIMAMETAKKELTNRI